MLKAIVTGAGGRMGGRIISLISSLPDVKVTAAVEISGHELIGKDVGEKLGLGETGVLVVDQLRDVIQSGDVIIDFTSHRSSLRNLEIAAEQGRAIVIGSTGFTPEEIKKIIEFSAKVPCILSPNMSVGVNVMFKIVEKVAEILGSDYDVEIVEAHHNMKKDAPSGTAVKMGDIIAKALDRDLQRVGVFGRKGLIGERSKEEIGIQTVRAGDIVGEHMVMFCGTGERIELVHRAHSRDNFARGAIRAAKWIVGKENGLYDMQDVLALHRL